MTKRYLPDDWALPGLTDANRPFFTAGSLVLQHCRACDRVQHPPGEVCRWCQSADFDHVEAAGTGVVDDVTVVHHAADARLKAVVPYNVVLVTPDGYPDVRILGNVVDAGEAGPQIGDRVRATFAAVVDPDTGEQLQLCQWELTPG